MTASGSVRLGALFAGLGVALGAFGAHAMKTRFPADALQTFETGVRWQMYHALALLACGALEVQGFRTRTAAALFVAGIVLFSGSLYAFVFTGLHPLVFVTPVGGGAFLLGWIALVVRGTTRSR